MHGTIAYNDAEENAIWTMMDSVYDPELPVLSVVDLGIVRKVKVIEPRRHVEIDITPTYSGCPAMEVITMDIRMKLILGGYEEVVVSTVLSPAWTSDWISERGKVRLKEYGIAPPGFRPGNVRKLFGQAETVQCPLCSSVNTTMLSEFGSTSCKALYRCNECKEPFDHFKCH